MKDNGSLPIDRSVEAFVRLRGLLSDLTTNTWWKEAYRGVPVRSSFYLPVKLKCMKAPRESWGREILSVQTYARKYYIKKKKKSAQVYLSEKFL